MGNCSGPDLSLALYPITPKLAEYPKISLELGV